MAEKISSRFEKEFVKDGMQMEFECAPSGGGVVLLKDLETGNWVCASIDWDGSIGIISSLVYPRASVNIESVSIHQKGQCDEIKLKANLKGEQK